MPRAVAKNTTIAPAPHLNGATYRRPRKKPLRLNAQRVARMEAIVDALILLLDEADGDPDEEPSLGSYQEHYGKAGVDLEDDECSGYGDHDAMDVEENGEAPLGWTSGVKQLGPHWRGDDGNDEHSFGWTEGVNQVGPNWRGVNAEIEPDPDLEDNGDCEPGDNGIADDGGVQEVQGEFLVRDGYQLDRERRGRSFVDISELSPTRHIDPPSVLVPEIDPRSFWRR